MTTTMPLIPLLILAHLTLTAATSGHIETVAAAPDTLRSFLHEEADERDEHYHQKPLARSDYPGKPQESAEEKMDVPDQTQHQATFKDGFPDGFAAGLENIEFNVPPPKGNRGFFEPPPENLAAAMSSLFDTEHPTLHPHVLQGSGSGQSGRAFHSGLQRRYDDNEPQVAQGTRGISLAALVSGAPPLLAFQHFRPSASVQSHAKRLKHGHGHGPKPNFAILRGGIFSDEDSNYPHASEQDFRHHDFMQDFHDFRPFGNGGGGGLSNALASRIHP